MFFDQELKGRIKDELKKFSFIKRTFIYQLLFYIDKNIYGTNYDKSVLISYINEPFRTDEKFTSHSNKRQARIIGSIFKEKGYNVDVYNYLYTGRINYGDYDVIFGFGQPFENSFKGDALITRIYYATEPHCTQRDWSELVRIRSLLQRSGSFVFPRRTKKWPELLSSTLCDVIFCTGNEWTISTYEKVFDGPIYRTPIGVYHFYPQRSLKRDHEVARANFLWFGSHGLVLKGLDLCIEAFSKISDINLHICGVTDAGFLDIYKSSLECNSNIRFYGRVEVDSEEFREIVEKCMFVVFPGASEAGCGSVLSAMATGLIPVVTEEASIDVDAFGELIESLDIDDLVRLFRSLAELPREELELRSLESERYVNNLHTFEKYEQRMRMGIEKHA